MRIGAKREKEEVEINLTPLIDVVFLLLIFFMVSTTFNMQSQLILEFPSATRAKKPIDKKENIIEITIDEKGSYYVNRQQLINSSRSVLKRALKAAIVGKRNIGSVPVIITAHAKAKHQHVVNAMFISRELGLINVLFSTVKSTKSK